MDMVNAIPAPLRGTIAADPALNHARRPLGMHAHALTALGLGILVLYASLFPFNFESRTLSEAGSRFEKGLASQPIEVGDFTGNVLLFLPLGYFLLGTLRVDRAGGSVAAIASALGVATVLSVSVEYLQAFFPPRTPCLNDIMAQVLGACVGIGVWECCGRALTTRARHAWISGDLREHAGFLLAAYTGVLVVMTLLSCRLEYRPEVLGFKLHLAFQRAIDLQLAPAGAAVYLWSLLFFLPTGLLAAFVHGDARRTMKLGLIVVLTVGIAELMVRGRRFDLFTVAVEMAAFALGWLQGRSMRGNQRLPTRTPSTTMPLAVSLGVAWVAAATALIHGEAFDFTDNPSLLLDRMGTMNWWPLNDVYGDDYLRVLRTALRQGAVFLVGGGVLALGTRPARTKGGTTPAAAAVALATALLLEVGQLTHPNQLPSVTAILWQATGACLGFVLVRGLLPAVPALSGLNPHAMPGKAALRTPLHSSL